MKICRLCLKYMYVTRVIGKIKTCSIFSAYDGARKLKFITKSGMPARTHIEVGSWFENENFEAL